MKKLFTLMLIMMATQMHAQIFIPIFFPTQTSIGIDGENIGDDYITWSQKAVDFGNFKGFRKSYEKDDYKIALSTYLMRKKTKIGNTTYNYNYNKTFYNTQKSWVNRNADLESLEKMCQLEFDLWQLCAQKAAINYNTNNNMTIRDMHSLMESEFQRLSNKIEKETDEGHDASRVADIDNNILCEIETLSFNPEEAIKDKKEGWGMEFSFGLQSHTPFTEYVNSAYGCYFDVGFSHAKHVFGLGANAEFFGKCQRDIPTSKGTILKGEGVVAGEMNLYYGYRTSYNKSVNLTPFVNIGARFYDGGTPDFPKKDNDTCEKSGFSLDAGMMFDIPIKRTVDIKLTSEKSSNYNTNSIQLKPYLSMTHFSGPMDWVPSINIAIGYKLQTITLK